jgi:hypothetical protein
MNPTQLGLPDPRIPVDPIHREWDDQARPDAKVRPESVALRDAALMEPYIDAHSHVWTPDVAHYPLAKGFTVANLQPRSFTPEELLAICRPAGVGRVNLIQMSYYEFDKSFQI